MARQRTAEKDALASLRVLELADEKGHYCGKLLASMGADVIKVEPPGGSPTRLCQPFLHDQPDPNRSLYFWHFNTNKRGVTLDLQKAEGSALLRRLVGSADVLLETFAPGYLASLGLSYEEVSKLNPRLVMASITPFGQTGPYCNFKTSELVSSAMGGLTFMCGYDDVPGSPPINPGGEQSYHIASVYGAMAVLAAIWARHHTGQGQYIDISIHEAVNTTTEWGLPTYFYWGENVRRQTGRHASQEPTQPWQFLARDGRHVNLLGVLPRETAAAKKLLNWMEEHGGVGELRDPKYASAGITARMTGGSWRNVDKTPEGRQFISTVVAFVQQLDSEEVYHGGQQRGLQWSVIRAPDEILEEKHLEDRGFFVPVSYPELGKEFVHTGAPWIFSEAPMHILRRAPLVGEHNQEVYCQELGLSPKEFSNLATQGVV